MSPQDINVIIERLDALQDDVTEIKAEVKATNGKVIDGQKRLDKLELREQDAKTAREQSSSRNTAAWGAGYATIGLAIIYTLLEIAHHLH